MAKKAKNDETEIGEVAETEEVVEKAQRRRQSPRVRLQFALNNLLNSIINNEPTQAAVEAGKNLLEDLGFGLRQSTVVTAGRIHEAMLGLDIMDDLTPQRMKKLGQLLGRAQRGEDVTDEQIEEIVGEAFEDADVIEEGVGETNDDDDDNDE